MVLFQCYERTVFHPMPYASEKQNLIKPVSYLIKRIRRERIG